ncbi:MAG: hypothetical protein LBH03_05520 [Holophagales bacterium]|jgi:ADP-heptose:LPS heptosyltransferase|nr:hypothetical protein [Holophagales bacterium]
MHLLLLRLSALGDILRVLPAWKSLLDAFPQAKVQAVVEDRHAFLLEPFSKIECVVVHRNNLSNPFRAIAELARVGNLVKGADISMDFHGILKSALIPYFAEIPERWGDGSSKEGAGLFQNNGPTYKKQSRYAQALRLSECFGLKHGIANLGRFEPVLKNICLPDNTNWPVSKTSTRQRILLVPGTSRAGANKRWPLTQWIQLANELKNSADLRWSLGPTEAGWRKWLPEKSGVEALPTMAFWELASVIRSTDRVIVGDTGLLHLSVLLGTQVIALMGPSDPFISDIPTGTGTIVRGKIECSPCREHKCLRRGCMEQLHLDKVLAVL